MIMNECVYMCVYKYINKYIFIYKRKQKSTFLMKTHLSVQEVNESSSLLFI